MKANQFASVVLFFCLGFLMFCTRGSIATPAPVTAAPVTAAPTLTPTSKSPTKAPTRAPTPPTNSPTLPACPDDPTDTDLDGITDCKDKCPLDFNKINPGMCGCGVSDALVDRDRNGLPECDDGKEPVLTGYYIGGGSNTVLSVTAAATVAMVVVHYVI